MAGDWLPMRLDLREDPAVIQMADQMQVREEIIVGYLHAVWSWLSRQCHDGTVTGVTLLSLGRVLNLPGFPELMRDAGWLIECQSPDGKPQIEVPNWDRWLSQSAKTRVKASQRQQKRRNESVTELSRSERDKSATTVQKSTEYIDSSARNTPKGGSAKPSARFTPPTIEQVTDYCRERGNQVDPQKWLDHYSSNGWKVGRNPMKDWKAAVRTWERNDGNGHFSAPANGNSANYNPLGF